MNSNIVSSENSLENEIEFKGQDEEGFEGDSDNENDKHKIVEESPKRRFIRFNEEIGSGAYKTVYRGYDNDSGCEVAWNVIKLQRLPQKERKRISDEINILKSLKHPNVIHFKNAWINRQKEEIIFITEIVTGGSLKSYLRRIKSPRLKVIKGWCREILQGIEYLHLMKPNPIIHRDIKCDNIFINSNSGEIRIGDLGLATCMSASYAKSVLGTPEFMAPEMYEESYGCSVDIYSFGMCLLEMATLQTPYRECLNAAQLYKKVISGKKPASLDLISNEEVKGFILECLKDQSERPTATELLQHKFLQITDSDIDNQPIKLQVIPLSQIEEECLSNLSRASEKPNTDGWFAVDKTEFLKQEVRGQSLKPTIEEVKSNEKPEILIHNDEPDELVLEEEASEKSNLQAKEDESNFQYQIALQSKSDQSYFFLLTKYRQDPLYHQERLIEIEKSKLNLETLTYHIKAELSTTALGHSLTTLLKSFIENFEDSLSKLREETVTTTDNPNKVYSFQPELFQEFYHHYLASIPQSYFASETSDEMTIRHQKEILELHNAHLIQKKLLLERKHNSLLSLSHNTHPLTPINQLRNTNYIGNDTPVDAQDYSNHYKYNAVSSMQSNRFLNEFNSISPISSGSWDQQFPAPNAQFGGNSTNAQLPIYHTAPLSGLISPYEQYFMHGGSNLPSDNMSGDFLNSVINKLQSQNNVPGEEAGLNSRSNQQHNEIRGGLVSPKNGLQNEQNYQGVVSLEAGNMKKPTSMGEAGQNMMNRIASPKPLHGMRNLEFTQTNSNPSSKASGQMAEQPRKQEMRLTIKSPPISDTNTSDQKLNGLPSGANTQQNAISISKAEQSIDIERKDTAFSSNSSSPNSLPSKTQEKDVVYSTSISIAGQNLEEKIKNVSKPSKTNLVIETSDNPTIRLVGQSKEIPRVEIEINNYISPKNGILSPNRDNVGFFKQPESIIQKSVLSPTAADPSMKKTDFFMNKGQKVHLSVLEKLKAYQLKGTVRRGEPANDEDVKAIQSCLDLLTDQSVEANGHYGHYTEKIVKSLQEKLSVGPPDGVVNDILWERLKTTLTTKLVSKSEEREREKQEVASKMLEQKKTIKDKQSKEANESLSKITSGLTNLTDL